MTRWLQIVLASCAVAVTGCAIWGGCGLNRHLIMALDAWGNTGIVGANAISQQNEQLKQSAAAINSPLGAINAPCVGFHGSVTCGPIAQLSQTAKNVGIVAGQSALQVKQSGVLIDAAAKSVTEVSAHVNRTADALTQTAQGATDTLAEGRRTIAAAQPVLAAFTRDGDDLHELLKSHAIDQTLTSVASMTESGAGILANGKTVSDKITYDFTHPVPWYKQPMKIVTLGVDAALLAK